MPHKPALHVLLKDVANDRLESPEGLYKHAFAIVMILAADVRCELTSDSFRILRALQDLGIVKIEKSPYPRQQIHLYSSFENPTGIHLTKRGERMAKKIFEKRLGGDGISLFQEYFDGTL